jgi:hypothetical protein
MRRKQKPKRPLYVYIAGPYSKGDVGGNVRTAIHAADFLMKQEDLNIVPYVPHLTHLWHMVSPKEYAAWMAYDRRWIVKCDVLIRLEGESGGADDETEFARMHGILVMDMRDPVADDYHRLWKRNDVSSLFYLMAAVYSRKDTK